MEFPHQEFNRFIINPQQFQNFKAYINCYIKMILDSSAANTSYSNKINSALSGNTFPKPGLRGTASTITKHGQECISAQLENRQTTCFTTDAALCSAEEKF